MRHLPDEPPAWVREYVGLPFEERGRTRRGLDCWGLVRLVHAERLGAMLPCLDEYTGLRDRRAIELLYEEELGRRAWAEVEVDELRVGDVAVLRGAPVHVGVMVARHRMLHATRGAESCVERLDSPVQLPRLIGFRRYAGPVHVTGRPRPFGDARIDARVPAGGTVAEILAAAGVQPNPYLRVFVSGVEVPHGAWAHVRPKPGRLLQVAALPGGGEGGAKTGLRIALSLAIVAAAAAAPAALGIAAGTVGAALVSGGVAIAGALAVSMLIPPAKPRFADSGLGRVSPTITGAGNQLRPYAPVPIVLGEHRVTPPYAARPYTEVVGDDTYLRCLFVVGYGPLELSDHRIGETPLSEFEGVELEVREGYPGEAPVRLFPGVVLEDEGSGLLEQQASWAVRRSRPDADELSIDISFPTGLARFNDDGSRSSRTVVCEAQYAPAGAEDWRAVNGESPDFSRGLDLLFRDPEVTRGGESFDAAPVAWGLGFGTKPAYLPSSGFSWEVEGWVYADAAGVYGFAVDSSDSGEVAVDGRVVASWYGAHGTAGAGTPDYTQHNGEVTLTRGWHPIRVRMEARTTTGAVALGWRPPGAGSWATVPATALRCRSLLGQWIAGQLRTRWFDISRYTGSLSVTANRAEQLRRSLTWAVPRGQYDVRVRRVTPDTTDPKVTDKAYWSALRVVRAEDPVRIPGLARVALRIKATDQLSGQIDSYNCVARSVVPDYDAGAGAWVERPTRNPAALYRAALQHAGNKRPLPDARVDLSELESWHRRCEERGYTYDAVLDAEGTLFERLAEISAAGRAAYGMRDGMHSVIQDRPRSAPVQHFTPRNSRGFSGRKAFPDVPHGLRVRYLDRENGYQQAERAVIDDGYQIDGRDAFGVTTPPGTPPATRFETLELPGVTDGELAFRHARYYLAARRLRPEVLSISCDVEHLACTRGDLVLVTHDVPLIGQAYGRVAALWLDQADNLLGLVLDEPVTMDAGVDYRISVRLDDGSRFAASVVTVEGEQRRVDLGQPVPPGTPRPKAGDLWGFGPSGLETRELIVKSVTMEQDLGARLELVDHAPAVHDAETGVVPPYDPGITNPPSWENRPETPVIESIRSDDLVMVRQPDGSLRVRMLITLRPPSGNGPLATHAQVRLREKAVPPAAPNPWTPLPVVALDGNQVSVFDVEEGVTYQLRVRTATPAGQTSLWAEAEHTVVGQSAPPPDLSTFGVERMSDGTRRFRWTITPAPPDLAGVRIRYGAVGLAWEQMTPLHSGVLDASPAELNEPPQGTWQISAKAVDLAGNESVNAVSVVATLGPQRLEGVVLSDDAGLLGWPGGLTSCFRTFEGTLEALDPTTWTQLPATWDQYARWNVSPRSPIAYTHTQLDVGFVAEASPDLLFDADGAVTALVSWSEDQISWSEWTPIEQVRSLAVRVRYLRARLVVAQTALFPVPVIKRLLVLLRAETVQEDVQDLVTASVSPDRRFGVGDVRIPVPRDRFSAISSVVLTFNNAGGGWTYDVVDKDPELGPRVRIYDRGGAPADATVDAVIRGLRKVDQGGGVGLVSRRAGALDFSREEQTVLVGAV